MSAADERRLARAKAKIAVLESMIEDRTRDLYLANDRLSRVLETISSALFVTGPDDCITTVNAAAGELLGVPREELIGRTLESIMPASAVAAAREERKPVSGREVELRGMSGEAIPALVSTNSLTGGEREEIEGLVCVATDLRERRQMEMDLRHAQKLESIGQLAAGIAHEINTPIQFVGDSAQFLQEAWEDLVPVLDASEEMAAAARGGADPKASLEKFHAATEDAELEFLREEVPRSLSRTRDGVSRVAKIVMAMKDFSHPGSAEMAPADLNRAIESTMVVAKNEYKYIADLELELREIPQVVCNLGDLNQVILNLVVNAAHAIEANPDMDRGRIAVATSVGEGFVVVRVEDDGGGVPVEVANRIFDPFFTTKEVGKGTGQGLSIAHNIVVDKHQGSLRLENTPGVGAAFIIELPVNSSV